MPMSAQKGLHRVLLWILSPLMCSEKGNHLEAAGMGVGMPNPNCSLLFFQRVLLCMSVPYFMMPQPMLELPLLLSICSPPVTSPRHSPAYTLDVTHSLFFGTALFPLMVPVSPCSYSSLHSRSVLPATVLDTGDKTAGKWGQDYPLGISYLAGHQGQAESPT